MLQPTFGELDAAYQRQQRRKELLKEKLMAKRYQEAQGFFYLILFNKKFNLLVIKSNQMETKRFSQIRIHLNLEIEINSYRKLFSEAELENQMRLALARSLVRNPPPQVNANFSLH